MAQFYPSLEIKQFLEMLRTHQDGDLYTDLLSYPSVLEEMYYAEMARDYSLADLNNSPNDVELKLNYKNLCLKLESLTKKKEILHEKILVLMDQMGYKWF